MNFITQSIIWSKESAVHPQIIERINIKSESDNIVSFLSQIGWIGDNNVNTPEPKIQMHKTFVDVDANGGNGGELFLWEIIVDSGENILHSKIPHRKPVCDKVIEYLEE